MLINLGFQFFVHTQAIGKIGGKFAWIEYVFNTPSIHRVHHARNDRYIDRNYAGVLVIWDRLFGSYVDEDLREPPVYGIVEPLHTYNPLRATFHEWASMARDFASARSVPDKLRALFAPPAWAADYHARRAAASTATLQRSTTTKTTTRPRYQHDADPGRFCKLSSRRRRGGRGLQYMAQGPNIRGDVANMKQTASRKQDWLRVTQIAVASAAFALLAACGGGGDDNNNASSSTPAGGVKLQVVSFGDSLSDVGTYAPVIQGSFGGGRFTTNPGEVWTQKVAEYYGDTLKPAYLGGFGQPLAAAGGFGYAQGGSDVVNAQGKGWAPNNMAATTVPIVVRSQNYLEAPIRASTRTSSCS